MLAGTTAQHGECRRRLQVGEDGVRPRQPVTHRGVECSEHLAMPVPERLARCCGDCRYWRLPTGVQQIAPDDEGLCRVWAPRWSDAGGYEFPQPRRDFYCGDGVSLGYIDPEDDENG